jgi:hypothetical protein
VEYDSDATVVMKYDDDQEAYPISDEMHEESDAMEVLEDDAKQSTYSTLFLENSKCRLKI